jgi:glycosyltransferase involved in cell wall biosynthesis
MKIALIEPFFSGSHRAWASELKKYSTHDVDIYSLPGRFWKWRMHGGAITLAKMFNEANVKYDLILVSDMLDLTTFISLLRDKVAGIPFVMYFHENQLAYPWSPNDQDPEIGRDLHYSFINYSSALCADRIMFNSNYNKDSFLGGLETFLLKFPDFQELENIEHLKSKSQVLELGFDIPHFKKNKVTSDSNTPMILWNHRWEYDKNPESFFEVLERLKKDGVSFELCLLGGKGKTYPEVFNSALNIFKDEIIHVGYCESFSEYANWLWRAKVIPVTSNQDFFGRSIIEAIYCENYPLLPKRLAYPELINGEEYYYENDDELFEKLKLYLQTPMKFSSEKLKIEIVKYDWTILIKKYDSIFESYL